jgi:DNA-binding NarL/FixJ family response regulator
MPATFPEKASLLIRILIADDHDAVRRGVRSVLLSRCNIEVCGEASNGREAIQRAVELKPDLIILDLTMPVLGGFAAAIELRRLLPDVPILFYSMHEGAHLIREAKQIGVRGFVSKSQISEELLDAVDALVVRKSSFFPPTY